MAPQLSTSPLSSPEAKNSFLLKGRGGGIDSPRAFLTKKLFGSSPPLSSFFFTTKAPLLLRKRGVGRKDKFKREKEFFGGDFSEDCGTSFKLTKRCFSKQKHFKKKHRLFFRHLCGTSSVSLPPLACMRMSCVGEKRGRGGKETKLSRH